jgi:DNA-binding LacI/PurR family transcriptional regulator
MNPRVTQRDIAHKANVSHVTVSLALRNDASIPEKTRKRIQKIAEQLGYSPDPLLTALASYRSQNRPASYHANIGWLMSSPHAGKAGWGDFSLYYKGAEQRARQLGYVLDEINLLGEEYKDQKNYKWLHRLLNARNITGVILPPSHIAAAEFNFDFSHYSAVRIGYSYRSPILHTVANSQFRTVLVAMQKVAALGYRRIACILTQELDERTSWQFLGGYLAGQHLVPREHWIPPFYTASGEEPTEAFYHWVVKNKVECFIAPGYDKLYRSLVKRGLDIGYADTQVLEEDRFFGGIHQNSRQVGVAAVDQLVSMMHRNDVGFPTIPSQLLIEGSWREGKTLKRIR